MVRQSPAVGLGCRVLLVYHTTQNVPQMLNGNKLQPENVTCTPGKHKNERHFPYMTADYDLSSSMPISDFIICLSVYAHMHVCAFGGGGGGMLGGGGGGGGFQSAVDPFF